MENLPKKKCVQCEGGFLTVVGEEIDNFEEQIYADE